MALTTHPRREADVKPNAQRTLIVVASRLAYVDPSVQVHASGCSHGLARWHDARWIPLGPYRSLDDAQRAADGIAANIKAADVTYCDCALFGPAGA